MDKSTAGLACSGDPPLRRCFCHQAGGAADLRNGRQARGAWEPAIPVASSLHMQLVAMMGSPATWALFEGNQSVSLGGFVCKESIECMSGGVGTRCRQKQASVPADFSLASSSSLYPSPLRGNHLLRLSCTLLSFSQAFQSARMYLHE